jgi:hypothetical protein
MAIQSRRMQCPTDDERRPLNMADVLQPVTALQSERFTCAALVGLAA